MAVDLSIVEDIVRSNLNASATHGGASDDPLFDDGEITDAVASAARGVIQVIVDTPGHRRRSEFLELQDVTDGAIITDTIGAVLIDGVLGTKISPSKLRRFKTNRFTTSSISDGGYYSINGHVISFIGSTAQVETIKDLTSGDISVPDEFQQAVVHGALSIIYTKQGSQVDAAGHHGSMYQSMLQMIRQGGTDMPAPTEAGNQA